MYGYMSLNLNWHSIGWSLIKCITYVIQWNNTLKSILRATKDKCCNSRIIRGPDVQVEVTI
jgi:hypothetical protein